MSLFRWLKERTGAVESATLKQDAVEDSDDHPEASVDPYNPFPNPVEIQPSDILDLHTISPREVQRVVEAYLEEAHSTGFPVVRIIHGKGIGVQREMVRSILARMGFVYDWSDAPPEAGGLGATIVRFRRTDAVD